MSGRLQGTRVSGQPPSRGWWRLTASVFAIVGATIGFGYYLPLRQANQLLEAEFEKARRSETALSQQLKDVKSELKSATEERDALREAKSKVDSAAQETRSRVQRWMDGLPAATRAAVEAKRLILTPTAGSLTMDVLDKTWLTPGGDGLTRNGHRTLCPALTTLPRDVVITIRTFVAPSPSPGESRWAAPGRLAAGVAETLIDRCKLEATALKLSTSGAAPSGASAPLLQLELQTR